MFSLFFRLLNITFKNFFRNIWLSIVTLSIVILSLLSINILITLNILTREAIKIVKDKVDISIYFKPEISEDQVYAFKSKVTALDAVKEAKYISSDEALEMFKIRHQNNSLLMDSLGELADNPLGAALVIKARDTDDYIDILADVEAQEFNEYANWIQEKNFNNYKLIIEKLNKITSRIHFIGAVVTALFLFITVLIIFNSIRVAIYTHREEIGIMRLVGATSWFVRGPFLIESVLYGLFAWLIATAIFYPLLKLIQPYLSQFLSAGANGFDIINYFNSRFLELFGWQLSFIILLSMISSSIAIRRYLKV